MAQMVISIYCPTYSYYLIGWRKWLHYMGFPKNWFKQKKERICYSVGDIIICSPANYNYFRFMENK